MASPFLWMVLMSFCFRRATLTDSLSLWQWRNDPLTRAMSRQNDLVPWTDHENWFQQTLKDPARTLYIAYIGSTDIGMVRFDGVAKDLYEVSINLSPAQRGKNLGAQVLKQAVKTFASEAGLSQKSDIVAVVHEKNPASVKVFQKAGFKKVSQDQEGWLSFTYEV